MSQAYKVEPVRHMSGAVVGYNVIHRETREVRYDCRSRDYADWCCQALNRWNNS
jgi:hypothetical protein